MTWIHQGGGWWRVSVASASKQVAPFLHDLSEMPGVQSVTVARETPDTLLDVRLVLHESVFPTNVCATVLDAFGTQAPVVEKPVPVLPPPVILRTLRSYQQDAVDWILDHDCRVVIGDEPGLGKTTVAIVAAARFIQAQGMANGHVLIVGPKFTRDVWRRELRAVLGDDVTFFACEGRKPAREQEQQMAKCQWWFCHAEILDGWRPAFTSPFFTSRPRVAIIDEAHWFRNPKSTRGKAVLATALLASGRIVLTGTPIANRVTDLWSLLTLATGQGAWGSSFAFAHRYTFHEKGTYGWTSSGTRRVDELQGRMTSCYLRRTVAEVGNEIPKLTRERYAIALPPIPKALEKWCGGRPDMALDRLRDAFQGGHLGTDTLTMLAAWRKWTSEVKLAATVELVASLLLEGESVVVFTWQKETVERICHAVLVALKDERDKVALYSIHGDHPQANRDQCIQEFQANRVPSAIVATIDSLREGVTLHAARRVIMHDLDWVPATMLQAEARIHRIGQTRPCISTWMVVEDSADQVIAEHLVAKAGVIAEALSDTKAEDAFDEVGLAREDATGAEYAKRLLGD